MNAAQSIPERIAILEERTEQSERIQEDTEQRLRKIERNQWLAAGFIAAVQIILKLI